MGNGKRDRPRFSGRQINRTCADDLGLADLIESLVLDPHGVILHLS